MSFHDRDTSEDLFADTRMSFGDHLEDMRWHLVRAIVGASVILVMVFVLDGLGYYTGLPIGAGLPLMHFISRPVERELMAFYKRRLDDAEKKIKEGDPRITNLNKPQDVLVMVSPNALREIIGLPRQEDHPEEEMAELHMKVRPFELIRATSEADREILRPPLLSTLSVTEGFMVYIKVSLVLGIVIGSPWIFLQIWSFVAAGLYPQEKHWVYLYGPFSLVLFVAGVILCEFIVMPVAVHYLLSFNEWMGLEPELRLNEWLSFALMTPLVFGIAFQTPLVMFFLHKLGIMEVASFQKNRRYAIMILAVAAAFLAASPDWVSMCSLLIPLVGLYELGIILCRLSPRTVFSDVPDGEEMVEV